MMALSIALSVIVGTGTGTVLSARIVYGIASYRVLPEFLGTVSRPYATPVAASIIVGLLIVGLSVVYYLATSVQNAFFDVIDVTGLLFSIFYIFTALAAMTYYRRRIIGSAWDFVTVGILPLGAARFLGWIFVKSLGNAPLDPALVAYRHRRRRPDPAAGRALRPALPVLPDRAGKRGRHPPTGRTALSVHPLLPASACP